MDELVAFVESLGVELPPGWRERILAFHEALVRANARLNLTRITDLDDFLFKHVADSLLVVRALPAVREAPYRVADVGCGGGFPGLALALTFPRLRVTEIDSSRRKIREVERFIAELGLTGCGALAGRARELGSREEFRAAFDLVVARAVTVTSRLIRECRRLLADGGALIAYKTPALVDQEGFLVEREAGKANLAARASEIYRLPGGRGERRFWIIRKP